MLPALMKCEVVLTVLVIRKKSLFSYTMMRKCWERAPHERPTFRKIYSDITQYLLQLGYLYDFNEGRRVGGGGAEGGGGGEGGGEEEEEEEKVYEAIETDQYVA